MKKALLISCFGWYQTRMAPIRDILIDKGYDVKVLIADFDHQRKAVVLGRYDECTYIHVPHYKKNLSIQRILSHLSFGKAVGKWLNDYQPDLVFLQIPPNNTARYCKKYKQAHPKTKLILDIVDLWPESIPLGKLKHTFPAIVWMKCRNDAIKKADHVFTECDLYQEKLKDIIDRTKTSTLYLYKEQTPEEESLVKAIIDNKTTDDNKRVRLAYLGSMNNIIDIDGICRVIRKLKDSGHECELRAIGDGESRDKFESALRTAGCLTHFYGPIYDELEKIEILAPCDYAFNMMRDNVNVGLTIKSIDYLSYGLPLFNSIKGDTWKLVEHKGVGLNVSDTIVTLAPIDHSFVHMVFDENFSKEQFIKTVREVIWAI